MASESVQGSSLGFYLRTPREPSGKGASASQSPLRVSAPPAGGGQVLPGQHLPHHQLPHLGWSLAPRLLTLAPPRACCGTWEKPLPLSGPSFSTGEPGTHSRTCSKAEREPRAASWIMGAQEVPPPGR